MAGNGLTQIGFRGREDDGSETAATWLAATNANWVQKPDINFRVRLLVEHDIILPWGGALRLFYSLNSETVFTKVDEESSVVRGAPTVHYTKGDDSTQQIGAGVFLVDNNGMAETDAITGEITFGEVENEEAELEYCLQIVASDVQDGDVIRLRAMYGFAELSGGYLEVPEITVFEPPTVRQPRGIFRDYLNEVQITGLVADSTWHTIDLAPFLIDPNASAVCIRATRKFSGTNLVGVRDVGSGVGVQTKVAGDIWFETVVGLAGGTSIQYAIASGQAVRLYITGEVHEPVVIHPTAIFHNLTEPDGGWGDWVPLQATPIGTDALEDIQAVIIKTVLASTVGTFGIRAIGSSDPQMIGNWLGGQHWWVVGLDENGEYEVASTGKANYDNEDVYFYEVGYILKGSNVTTELNSELYGLPVQSPFGPLDLSADYPDRTLTVGGKWHNADTVNNNDGFLIGTGGARPSLKQIYEKTVATQMVTLDGEVACEYVKEASEVGLYIHWWEIAKRRIFLS